MLKVQLLDKNAKAPTVANSGEDLGYDLYALEDTYLTYNPTKVRTGIAVQMDNTIDRWDRTIYGFFVKDRSSIAAQGIFSTAGVIDAGYTGEIIVLLTDTKNRALPYEIKAGTKIAQLVPIPVNTGTIRVVKELAVSNRGDKGFGSSGA